MSRGTVYVAVCNPCLGLYRGVKGLQRYILTSVQGSTEVSRGTVYICSSL